MSTKIILALDYSDGIEADKIESFLDIRIVRLLFDYVDGFKINHTLYGLVDHILNIKHPDKELFVDFKLWDTPNTVKNVIEHIIKHQATMTTVSTYNNPEVFKTISEYGNDIKLLGVSFLTSWTDQEVNDINAYQEINDLSESLLTKVDLWRRHINRISEYNFSGVVCPVEDIRYINQIDDSLIKVCPGIRLEKYLSFSHTNSTGDYTGQIKVSTMAEAEKQGADYVVVGRSITNAKDPIKAIKDMRGVLYINK